VNVDTSPHSFKPLRPWDALYSGGRCRACFAPKYAHPMHCWVAARPLGDKRRAELSFEALSKGPPK
jgi:hypothetical protein